MSLPIFQVDAFTSRAYAGNPAAVCLLDATRSDNWMQALAAEMNLSETAFVLAEPDGFRLRWFTPRVEVDLCGHATLASAHVLWTESSLTRPQQPLRFHTRSGTLLASPCGAQIELDFPAEKAELTDPPAGLLAALQLADQQVRFVGRNRMDYLIEVDSQQTLAALTPQFAALAAAPVRGTIVTSRAVSPDCDFVSRFFAPRVGVDEDPVTGSAHCLSGSLLVRPVGPGPAALSRSRPAGASWKCRSWETASSCAARR